MINRVLYLRILAGNVQQAVTVIEDFLGRFPDVEVDLTHINILAELYVETKQHGRTISLLENAAREMLDGAQLPEDLAAKKGLALLALERMDEAK